MRSSSEYNRAWHTLKELNDLSDFCRRNQMSFGMDTYGDLLVTYFDLLGGIRTAGVLYSPSGHFLVNNIQREEGRKLEWWLRRVFDGIVEDNPAFYRRNKKAVIEFD